MPSARDEAEAWQGGDSGASQCLELSKGLTSACSDECLFGQTEQEEGGVVVKTTRTEPRDGRGQDKCMTYKKYQGHIIQVLSTNFSENEEESSVINL